jgi:hypothetical protein
VEDHDGVLLDLWGAYECQGAKMCVCVCVCVCLFNVRADHVIKSRVLRPLRGKGRRGRKAPGILSSGTSYIVYRFLQAGTGFT